MVLALGIVKAVSIRQIAVICSVLTALSGCYSDTCAPVVNAWRDPAAMQSCYRVQDDDTLYSIAWAFDLDYRDLARTNHLAPPYHLKPGQLLNMQVPTHSQVESGADVQPVKTFVLCHSHKDLEAFREIPIAEESSPAVPSEQTLAPIEPKELDLPEIELKSYGYRLPETPRLAMQPRKENLVKTALINESTIKGRVKAGCWQWPARGKVVRDFNLDIGGCKGVDIAGNLGDSVKAVAPGKVVYSGSGLRGYGNLVIIKHSDNYLSAYAYNKKLLVKEGDVVRAGEEIGKMGINGEGKALLHFEIRRNGKPVNPLLYL